MLNIDELIGEEKKVVYKGAEYLVQPVTLGLALEAEKLSEVTDEEEILSRMLEITGQLIPGLPIEEMPLRVLEPIFNYVMDTETKDDEAKNVKRGRPKK